MFFNICCDILELQVNEKKYSYHRCIQETLNLKLVLSQPVFTCSKLAIETLDQGVNYIQS